MDREQQIIQAHAGVIVQVVQSIANRDLMPRTEEILKVSEQNGWGDIRLKDYIVDNAYQRWIARDSLSNPDGVILENKGNSQQRYFLRTPTSDGQRIKVRTNKAAAATWNITTVTTIL